MPGLSKCVTYSFPKIDQLEPSADGSFGEDDSGGMRAPFAETLMEFTGRLNSSTVGVALYDKALQCQAVNAALARMHGTSACAHVGKTIRQIFGQQTLEVEPIFRRVWETGNPFSNFLLTSQPLAATKETRWLVNLYPIKDEPGRVRLIAMTFSEVTKRSSLESHLSRLTNKFRPDVSGKSDLLGEEFTERCVRTLDLVRRSVELLKFSMSLRCRVSESRIENGLMRQALSLRGARTQKLTLRLALPRGGTEAARALQQETPKESELPAGCPSPRERQILYLLADGKSNKEIGTVLAISTRTVEFYRARIMLKLDLHSTAALVRYAIRNNIVEA
jgi:DNA-binding CsgD family transcriptional regulator